MNGKINNFLGNIQNKLSDVTQVSIRTAINNDSYIIQPKLDLDSSGIFSGQKYYDEKIKSSNTFNLLKYIKTQNKKSELFFLIGADNLKKFHKWKNWNKIPKLAKIVVFPRKNYSNNSIASKKLHKKDLIYIKSKKINISSSLIRKFW